jgi:hypothetical protein
MPLTPEDRKKLLGHGGLTRVARRAGRTVGHVSEVNRAGRPDEKVQALIAKEILKKRPDISPADIWPTIAA